MAITPALKPQITKDEADAILFLKKAKDAPLIILAVRGYFEKSMGHKEKNDRRIYDDAVALVTKDGIKTFNFNTDPNGYRPGHGTGAYKGMASLHEGLYEVHMMRKHKGKYAALCQDGGPVVVRRDADSKVPAKDIIKIDGDSFYLHKGNFGINLHMGGINGTSSEGCLTWPQSQYWDAMNFIYATMKANKMTKVQVCLVNLKEFMKVRK